MKLHVFQFVIYVIHAISNPVSSPRIKVTTQFFFRIGFSGSESTRKISNPVDLTIFLKNRGPEGGIPFKGYLHTRVVYLMYCISEVTFIMYDN